MTTTRKEIAKSVKTLLIMLQSLRDQQVTITLRNDTIVKGTIFRVDADMNVELANASVEMDPFYCTNPVGPQTSDGDRESTGTDNDASAAESRPPGGSSEMAIDDDLEMDEQAAAGASGQFDSDENDEDEPEDTSSALYDYFIVKGSRIRHIDLPADRDLVAGTKREIERIRSRRKQWTKRDIVRSSKA